MGQRGEHGDGKGIDMVERQHSQYAVTRGQPMFGADSPGIGRQIGLRKHYAFGHASSARGVHQQSHSFGLGFGHGRRLE